MPDGALPQYELFAIRYATRDARRTDNFIGGDPSDAPMPMDYFVWVAISPERTFVIDTALSRETAAKRKRTFLHSPIDILARLGVDAKEVKDVILTHLHNDHTGFIPSFPAAQFHLQEAELHFAVGHYMEFPRLARAYEVDDVLNVVRLSYANRIKFYFGGDAEAAPGITLHHVGGHTAGQMFVRVHTQRGWVVVANDVMHYYDNMETGRPFAQAFHVGDMLDGFGRLLALAPSKKHIVAGHDPLVMQRYPAPRDDLQGIVVRLDVEPSG
jgi:glyoxylase-like metal-dependent hydrolase (beta-lactamase superfamily II)